MTGGAADSGAGVRVNFPAGCLTSESILADISFPGSAPAGPVPDGLTLTDVLFELEPSGVTFELGVFVTVDYSEDDLNGVAEQTLTALYYDEGASAWSAFGIETDSLDTDTNTLVFTTDHFTVFALAGELTAGVPGIGAFGIVIALLAFIGGTAYVAAGRRRKPDSGRRL